VRVLTFVLPVVFTRRAIMAKKSGFRPGEAAPNSGQYREIGPRGGKGREVTSIKDKTLPPTSKKGRSYTLVDPTKNKAGQGE
jgi:hypothetical protein